MDLGGNIDKLLPFYVLQIRKHRAVALHYGVLCHGDFNDRSFRGSENRNRRSWSPTYPRYPPGPSNARYLSTPTEC
ncbi:uncharacterized protein CCOS01_15755 [Colletotrichum costaricense]|uniref:Uncharacterized protein n=1 Tax=Colletotrichum costaricense TaxID=1209916 RepID=A0AAI9YH97_9PEZI|nr:uncharacterized protein CCOS01_15755 [Colletotrichum costaricense]KAK1509239.1 hypothetical protein CCOS01_15755 [Colletotrichum costaricense]